jgi:hypothetical protein
MSHTTHLLLFFFVNDIVLLYDRRYEVEMNVFQARLFKRFEMKCLDELKWFLEIRITRDRDARKLWLCQKFYVEKLISKFNINLDTKTLDSPLFSISNFFFNDSTNQTHSQNKKLIKHEDIVISQQIQIYQQRVEFINFATIITRSNVAQIAFKLSEFLTNSSSFHLELVNRIIKYLDHIKKLSIEFNEYENVSREVIFLTSSDVSFADDVITRYSSQKYAFKLFNDMIDWKTSKQRIVIISSTEIELLTIFAAKKEMIWWNRLFEAINFRSNQRILTIQCDNMQIIRILITNKLITKLRHVDIHKHWLRQEMTSRKIFIQWVSITKILTDELTKALPPQRHQEFVRLLRLNEHVDVDREKNDQNEKNQDSLSWFVRRKKFDIVGQNDRNFFFEIFW